jgi:uncharacterized protein YigA (DUF484 family)
VKSRSQAAASGEAAECGEVAICEALRADPTFFLRHPQLVCELQIPHDSGAAVSLLSHQIEVMRRQQRRLEARFDDLVNNARGNEALAGRLHRLVVALLQADRLDELLTTLYQGLEEGFAADLVAVRLFTRPKHARNAGLAEFIGESRATLAPFADLLASTEPRCGRGSAEQLAVLFDDRAGRVASLAMIPLTLGAARGVLAIASRDDARLREGLGTHYLRQLGEVVGALVAGKL